MQKVTPYLWFDGQAEEAANFYVSLFENSRILAVNRMGDSGKAFVVTFHLDGQDFVALNGGPAYHFTEAISMYINCEDQAEVDRLWAALCEGGQAQQCGWLKDRFGLSWQVIPARLVELMSDPDPVKAGRVREAMLKMIKIDVAELERAAGRA